MALSRVFGKFGRRRRARQFERDLELSPGYAALQSFLREYVSVADSEQYPMTFMVFQQFCENIKSVVAKNGGLTAVLRVLQEPEDVFFRTVVWTNEYGETRTNFVWRCHYSSVLGPCRGPIRLHPCVTADTVRAMAFQQTVQNALLNLPMGGGMTASDFDARNATDGDLRLFAQEFVIALRASLNPEWPCDVAADLGCGPRECAVLQAAFVRLRNLETGLEFPLVVARHSATGLGAVEFAKRWLGLPSFDKTTCIVTGAGDCAMSVAANLIAEGAQVTTLSDSTGFIHYKQGLSHYQLQRIKEHKVKRTPLRVMLEEDGWLRDLQWFEGKIWASPEPLRAHYVFPCSHEFELDAGDCAKLLQTRAKAAIMVSTYSCTPEALEIMMDQTRMLVAPSSVASIGGVAALGMNMAEKVTVDEFEHRLKAFVHYVHDQCAAIYEQNPSISFTEAADICSFTRIGFALRQMGKI